VSVGQSIDLLMTERLDGSGWRDHRMAASTCPQI